MSSASPCIREANDIILLELMARECLQLCLLLTVLPLPCPNPASVPWNPWDREGSMSHLPAPHFPLSYCLVGRVLGSSLVFLQCPNEGCYCSQGSYPGHYMSMHR